MEIDYQYVTLDEKVTTWLRHLVQVRNVNNYEEAVEKVKDLIIKDELFNHPDIFPVESQELSDCEVPMTIEENNGEATVEILDNKCETIWKNTEC